MPVDSIVTAMPAVAVHPAPNGIPPEFTEYQQQNIPQGGTKYVNNR